MLLCCPFACMLAKGTSAENRMLQLLEWLQENGVSTPLTLAKANDAAQRLRWLLQRVVRSKLSAGVSRETIQKILVHFWFTVGKSMCEAARAKVLAREGLRASADHTYHVVSNLAAKDETGRFRALRASLTSVMGEDFVLGCQVCFAGTDLISCPPSPLPHLSFITYRPVEVASMVELLSCLCSRCC